MKNMDEQRGAKAFREGRPYNPNANIDWQRGYDNAAQDAKIDALETQRV